jgi:hypothetical protein
MPDTIQDIIDLVRSGVPQPGVNETPEELSGVPQIFGTQKFMPTGSQFNRPTKTESGATIVKPLDYTISPFAVYDRLSDGSYVSKYPNIIGAEGNEERLAQQQSKGEKWWNGFTKFRKKVGNYAFDATVGSVYGIYQGLTTGDFHQVWDNDFSNWMDDVNKKLDNRLPNFYTDEEKSMNLLQSMGTANFWADDFLGGLAFVGGALLPELAIGVLSGGASLPVGMAKIGARMGMKGALKVGKVGGKGALSFAGKADDVFKFGSRVDDLAKIQAAETAFNSLSNLRRANFMNSVGSKLNTARFLIQSSGFEAGMEARHNMHQAVDEFYENFEAIHGRMPDYEEAQEFMDSAVKAGNYVYGANLAILSVSNSVMFGTKFNVGMNFGNRLTNAGNRLIGLGYRRRAKKEVGKLAMQKVTAGGKLRGRLYNILHRPAVEGLYEEGLQGVAGKTMQNYLKAKYDPEVEKGYDLWASLTDAFDHQYTSNEGWKEMAIGMLIGFGAPMLQGQAPNGIGKQSRYAYKRKAIEDQVEAANKSQTQLERNITTRVNDATGIHNYGAVAKSNSDNFEASYVDNAVINAQYIKIQEQVKPKSAIVADYDAVIDKMELSEGQLTEIGGTEGLAEYKDALKKEFRENLEQYEFAKKTANSLGFSRVLKGENPANVRELEDAVIMTIMTGKGSLNGLKNIGKQIDDLIGTSGAFSYLYHFSNLNEEKVGKVKELRNKKQHLKRATEQSEKYARELAGLQTSLRAKMSDEKKQERLDKATKKSVLAQQEIQRIGEEIATLEEALNEDLAPNDFNLDQTMETDAGTHNIMDIIEELDKISKFSDSLALSGRVQEAEILDGLVREYKMYADAHREMNNMVRRMYDSNFFKTKEGRGFMALVTGERYKMSDEFRKILKDNDEVIDESMRKAGLRTENLRNDLTREKILEDIFGESNPILSDREKHKMEAIFRLMLGYSALEQKIGVIKREAKIVDTAETPSNNPLDGDTVALKGRLEKGSKDLTNVQVLDNVINQILSTLRQFEFARGIGRVDQAKIDRLEQKLKELKAQKRKLELEDKDKSTRALIEGRKKDLEAAKEFGKEDEITKLEDQIAELEEKLTQEDEVAKIDEQIKVAEEEIANLNTQGSIRIVRDEEYKRLDELEKKRVRTGELTEEEVEEYNELRDDIDQWMIISGVVVEGNRLSDLLKQRAVLENVTVAPVEKVDKPSASEVISSVTISDKKGTVYYNLAQTYDSVTAVRDSKTGEIEISGITWDAFMEEAGIEGSYVELNKQGNPKAGILRLNKRGNILLSQDNVDMINELGNISILPTNESLTTNYSVVLKHSKVGEETTTGPLKSNFGQTPGQGFFSYKRSGGKLKKSIEKMNPNHIYNMEVGEEITLEVSPIDDYNAKLLDAYRKARKENTKEKALKNLQDNLIIRVRAKGTKSKKGAFVAVLKGKRYDGIENKELARKFKGLRDSIVNDEAFLENLLKTKANPTVNLDGVITVKEIKIGHPTFLFERTGNGTVAINKKQLDDKDIDNVVDIGYYHQGKAVTRSGKTVNSNFMKKAGEVKPEVKLPFVVVRKGNIDIAIPVEIDPEQRPGLEEFEDIYNSNMNDADKASALNEFMASRGIDVRKAGNSFVYIGENSNVNDEFYSEKLADLESIEYFRDLDSWIRQDRDMALLLRDGVSTSIDLANPVHSPKLGLNYDGLNIEINDENTPDTQSTNNKTAEDELDSFNEALDNARNKEC